MSFGSPGCIWESFILLVSHVIILPSPASEEISNDMTDVSKHNPDPSAASLSHHFHRLDKKYTIQSYGKWLQSEYSGLNDEFSGKS